MGLRNKFMVPTLVLTVIGFGLTIFIANNKAREAVETQIKEELNQVVKMTEIQLVNWVENVEGELQYWGNLPELTRLLETNEPSSYVNDMLARYASKFDYLETIALIDDGGKVLASAQFDQDKDMDMNVFPSYKQALEQGSSYSEIMLSPVSGNSIFTLNKKITVNGKVGIIMAVLDLSSFTSTYIEPIKVGENGYAYVLDDDGTFIAHPDNSLILKSNVVRDYEFGKKLYENEKGVFTYTFEGEEKVCAYIQSPKTHWVIAAGAYMDEMFAPVKSLFTTILLVGLLSMVVIGAIIYYISESVAKPIKGIINNMGKGFEEINSASSGVSESSQSLANGAAKQAASMEETTSSLEEISIMVKQNAQHTKEVDNLIKTDLKGSFTSMNEQIVNSRKVLSAAVDASNETAKVIKDIDDIAFQTNLLALNAAVEAARAGDAGKGFAVVANEVRNLAQRAADAAQQTAELIENSNHQILESTSYSEQISDAMTLNMDIVEKASQLVAEISQASSEQTDGIEQINNAINQIDQVTQSVASGAEESAAAAEEMDAQVQTMTRALRSLFEVIEGQNEVKKSGISIGDNPVEGKVNKKMKNKEFEHELVGF